MITHCEKCGGNVDVARLSGQDGREVELAGVFALKITSVDARVCTNCGYIELYAVRPNEVTGPDVMAHPALARFDE